MIKVGSQAPGFEVMDDQGKSVRLSDVNGKGSHDGYIVTLPRPINVQKRVVT